LQLLALLLPPEYFVFRNSNPAIFGVKIDAGKLKQDIELINKQDRKIGRIKTIQQSP
jgi:translation initiation factor 5B